MNFQIFTNYLGVLFRHPRLVLKNAIFRLRIHFFRKFTDRQVILIDRASGIGDIICTFPALIALRKIHPRAVFVYRVRKEFIPAVKMGKVADIIIDKTVSDFVPGPLPSDYYTQFSLPPDLIPLYSIYYPMLLADDGNLRPMHGHLVDDFCEIIGVIPKSRQPRLYIPRRYTRFAKKYIAQYSDSAPLVLGIHIGPTWAVREWPPDSWSKLIEMIRARFDCIILQIGSEIDTEKGRVKLPRINNTIDCVGKFSLEETAAVISKLNCLIGVDSGLLHVAGAVGTPCVGLFGPVPPLHRLPTETPSVGVTSKVACLGCNERKPVLHWRDNCPYSIACMKQLDYKDVFNALCILIDKKRSHT